jgi:hypothetical protein
MTGGKEFVVEQEGYDTNTSNKLVLSKLTSHTGLVASISSGL